ncbi:expressed protein [Echinococcus multilocularis]|uniref:Expressed protein n=1 Tax=Echinococcus multilocularis TaxID=6211 RepID=A0A068Y1W0_ECHMU|nr:expressed protein [Echinococcus multilocularis]
MMVTRSSSDKSNLTSRPNGSANNNTHANAYNTITVLTVAHKRLMQRYS